jgi:hypothetical protein
MKTLAIIALGALLSPAVAFAQAPDDQAPPPPPAQQQNPVVVVNPQTQPAALPPPAEYSPQYETVYDDYNAPIFFTGAFTFAAAYGGDRGGE